MEIISKALRNKRAVKIQENFGAGPVPFEINRGFLGGTYYSRLERRDVKAYH